MFPFQLRLPARRKPARWPTPLAQPPPMSPTQTCTVTNGTGTAAANVGNIQITCSTGTIAIGGTVSGLSKAGSGIVLQNNSVDSLALRANGTFAMPTLVSAGSAYKI